MEIRKLNYQLMIVSLSQSQDKRLCTDSVYVCLPFSSLAMSFFSSAMVTLDSMHVTKYLLTRRPFPANDKPRYTRQKAARKTPSCLYKEIRIWFYTTKDQLPSGN